MTKEELKNIGLFYGMCFQRAWSDTLAFFGYTWLGALKFLFPTIVGLLILSVLAAASERPELFFHVKTIAASLAASLICAFPIFFVNLIAAPYRVRMESFTDQSSNCFLGKAAHSFNAIHLGLCIDSASGIQPPIPLKGYLSRSLTFSRMRRTSFRYDCI